MSLQPPVAPLPKDCPHTLVMDLVTPSASLSPRQILAEMLSVGVSVLLSDVDVVFTMNPFVALVRDSDVEGMSDGWARSFSTQWARQSTHARTCTNSYTRTRLLRHEHVPRPRT